jgi:hypothetical protein
MVEQQSSFNGRTCLDNIDHASVNEKNNGSKEMKKQFKNLIGTCAAAAAILWLAACATQTSNVAATSMEGALLSAGFKVKTATTAEQRNQLRTLPDNRFEMVKQGDATYYLYADKRERRLYAGDQWAYRAYVGYVKNNQLREEGAFVFEVDPSNKANNKTVVVWHGWGPFPEWSER